MKYLMISSVFILFAGITTASFIISDEDYNTGRSEEIQTEDEVLVLTKNNFQKAVEENKFLMVAFYAPWCRYSRTLMPEYTKAAKELSEFSLLNIKFGKVDGDEEAVLADENSIRGYPTLKFYHNGKVIDYTSRRTADRIVHWVKEKTGIASITSTTPHHLTNFIIPTAATIHKPTKFSDWVQKYINGLRQIFKTNKVY